MKYPIDMNLTAILADIYAKVDEDARGIIDDAIIGLLPELGYTISDDGTNITDELKHCGDYEIIYDCDNGDAVEESWTGTPDELKAYTKRMRENGCYNIRVTAFDFDEN